MPIKTVLLNWKQPITGRASKVLKDILDAIATPHSFTDVVKPKVYRALLTQASTDAPTVVVLQNDLSAAIVWTRTGLGVDIGTLSAAFVSGKTFLSIAQFGAKAVAAGVGGFRVQVVRTSANVITVTTGDGVGNTALDVVLNETPIQVRVYQS